MNRHLRYGLWWGGCAVLLAGVVLAWLRMGGSVPTADPLGAEEQYQLARRLYSGTGGAQDVARAVNLFETAAGADHPGAQLKMGVLHEHGIGFAQDWQKAAHWYFAASGHGHPAAQMQLGVLLSRSLRDRGQPLTLQLGTNEVSLPDYDRAAEWLHAAAKQDYPPAQLLLGDLIRINFTKNGTNVLDLAERYGNAGAWMEKAAEGGFAEAALKAAYGYSAMGNANLTTFWFYVAKQLGFEEANDPLSRSLSLLSGAEREKARLLAGKIRQGKARAEWLEWHQLIYLQNPGPAVLVPGESTNQFAALRASAEGGSVMAQFHLALNLQHPETYVAGRVPTRHWGGEPIRPAVDEDATRLTEAVQWYQMAAQKGHPDAQFHLATLFRHGLSGVEDFAQAQNWYERAARSGHREAAYQLAVMLDEGFAGTVRPEEATDWFKKAAAAGHVAARVTLEEREKLMADPVGVSALARPARLAVVPLSPELNVEADLLIVALAGQRSLELVERQEVERILKEQELEKTQARDFLKLGQLLKADGLLLLEARGEKETMLLTARLVAVGPGAILGMTETPLPIADPAEWSRNAIRPFSPYWSKLVVTARDAIPVSLLNLRSAISLPNEPGLDRQLTVFLKHRLLRQPELFVLERSRMDQLIRETELTDGMEDQQKFWGGSYLLEGVLNKDGLQAGEIGIHLRLISPGRKVTEFTQSGPVGKPEQILDQLAGQLVAELVRGGRHLAWKPRAEAQQYFEEARWALQQNLVQEAHEAAEAAWALGSRNSETLNLRIHAYGRKAATAPLWRWKEGDLPGDRPLSLNADRLNDLLLAFNLYSQAMNRAPFNAGISNIPPAWLTLGGSLIRISARTLTDSTRKGYELQQPFAEPLARLRQHSRALIQVLLPAYERMENPVPGEFLSTVVFGSALFYDDISGATNRMHELVRSGHYRRALDLDRYGNPVKVPVLVTWNGDPKGKELLYKAYQKVFAELEKDADISVRQDVLLGRLMSATTSYQFEDHYRAFWDLIWNGKETNAEPQSVERYWKQLGSELSHRNGHEINGPLERLRKERTAWEVRLKPWLDHQEALKREAERKEWFAKAKMKHKEFMEKVNREREANKKTPEELLAMYRNRVTHRPEEEMVPEGPRITLGRVTQTGDLRLDQFWTPPARFKGETNDVLTTILALDTFGDDIVMDVSRKENQEQSRHWLRLRSADLQMEVIGPPLRLRTELLPGHLELERRVPDRKVMLLDDQLYRLGRTGLIRYSLKSKEWEVLPMALPEYCRLHVAGSYLLASNHEGIYHVDPVSRSVKILASNRRRPAETPLDNFPNLEMGDICPLGTEHVVMNVNRRIFTVHVTQRRWRELNAPGNYDEKLKSLAGSVLFQTQDRFGLGGYVRMTGVDSKMVPFMEANFMGATSVQAVLNTTGEGVPRWFLAGDKDNWHQSFTLDVAVLGDSLLATMKSVSKMSAGRKESLQKLGPIFLCDPGLIEPVKLVPVAGEVPAAALKYEAAKAVSLHVAGKLVLVAPDNGAGFWIVPVERLAQVAEAGRARLRNKVQHLAVEPIHPWLKKIREERKAY